MVINLGFIAPFLNILYTDRCDIYHFSDVDLPNGTTKTVLPEEPTFVDVPCNISFLARGRENFHHSVEKVNNEKQPKLFMSPNQEVFQGDKIVARKMNGEQELERYTGLSNIPSNLGSHKVVTLDVNQDA